MVSPALVKSIFLKTGDLLCVLKMIPLWTPLIKTIIVFWQNALFLKHWSSFVQKRRNSFQLFITQKVDNNHFFSLYYFRVKKKLFLHCSLNLSLWKKCSTQIFMFFTESAGFLRLFTKTSSRSLKLTKK